MENKLTHIFLNCNVTTKRELYAELAEYLQSQKLIDDSGSIIKEFHKRESVGSLLIEENFALPHVKSKHMNQTVIVFVRPKEGVRDWEDTSDSVEGVLFLLIKKDEDKEVLLQIKKVMQSLAEEEVIELLLNSEKSEIENFFERILYN